MYVTVQNNFGLCSLEITAVRLEDSGLYIVKASNVEGQITCSASLQVEHGNSLLSALLTANVLNTGVHGTFFRDKTPKLSLSPFTLYPFTSIEEVSVSGAVGLTTTVISSLYNHFLQNS